MEQFDRFKEVRRMRGLSLEQVSEELFKRNIPRSPASISAYETGKRRPNARVAVALADIYRVSMDYLLCMTDFFVDKK